MLDHFQDESIVETDTLCKKDTISGSKIDFNALEIMYNDIHENDINYETGNITNHLGLLEGGRGQQKHGLKALKHTSIKNFFEFFGGGGGGPQLRS